MGKFPKLKTIITGSRDCNFYPYLLDAIDQICWEISEVVSGTCRGGDKLGETYAKLNKIPLTKFLPDWNKYGKKAESILNEEMADYAEALIALWDGKSKGTKNMIDITSKKVLMVFIYEYKNI